jgi:hypothetical protein
VTKRLRFTTTGATATLTNASPPSQSKAHVTVRRAEVPNPYGIVEYQSPVEAVGKASFDAHEAAGGGHVAYHVAYHVV